jgi:hypothetical protein
MCSAIARRISYAELVWQPADDGRQVVADVAFRPVGTCSPERDRNNRITGFRQRAYVQGRGSVDERFLFERHKAFVYVHDGTLNPSTGSSAFETAWHDFEDKRKVKFYRFKNVEKFGGPSTVGKTSATGEKRKAFERAVATLRSVGTAVIGPEESVDYMSVTNPGTTFRQTITDLNFEMAVSTLVQYLAYAQEGNSGSYNASYVQNRLLVSVTEGRIAEMEGAASRLCGEVCLFNFGPNAAVPTIQAGDVSEEPKERLRKAAETHLGDLPGWFREALEEAYARQLGIEKPEGASSP